VIWSISAQPKELSDHQLDCELTIAASAIGRLRFQRYETLLAEAQLRGLVLKPDVGPEQDVRRRRSHESRR